MRSADITVHETYGNMRSCGKRHATVHESCLHHYRTLNMINSTRNDFLEVLEHKLQLNI